MQSKEQMYHYLMQYKQCIAKEAEMLLPLPMPVLTESLFSLYEKTGDRLQYENVYFERRKFLGVFGIKALLEKDEVGQVSGPILWKLERVIEEICAEECWALPAHLSRQYPQWRYTIDLFASETAQTLSELADRLRGTLSEQLYQSIRENVEKRILNPFFSTPPRQFGWEGADHNWNAVITGSIGSACIHLWGEYRSIDLHLQRICDSLLHYIGGFAEDGTCMEGCGYYTYGMSYFVNFAQELFQYTRGKRDLLRGDWGPFRCGEDDKRGRIASFQSKCFFADGTTVSFSDGNRLDKYSLGLQLALKKRFPQVVLSDLTAAEDPMFDHCWRFVFRKLDILETEAWLIDNRQDVQQDNAKESVSVLPNAQWCIAEARNGVGMACKGGYNAEPHNHNDAGHFIYEGMGTAFLADLGAGEYTRTYFSDDRYEIMCTSSFGHSVPIIDGQGQQFGEEYRCTDFETNIEKDKLKVFMDISQAYGKSCGTVLRSVVFSLHQGDIQVTDRFRRTCGQVLENLITQCLPVVKYNQVFLAGENATAILTVKIGGAISIKEFPHSNHWGEKQTVYAIQWDVDPVEAKSVFEVAITPR